MLKNSISKEGTHGLSQNYQRYFFEEETIIDKTSKKVRVEFVSITSLDGYNNFSQEELRRIDLLYKKTNFNKQNFLRNDSNIPSFNNFQVLLIYY